MLAPDNETPITQLDLPPGVERPIDFLHLEETRIVQSQDELGNDVYGPSGETMCFLEVFPGHADARHVLPPGEFQVGLVVTADDVDASHFSARVVHDGEVGASLGSGVAVEVRPGDPAISP